MTTTRAPQSPVAQTYLCRGCDALYRTQTDGAHHVRVFACGPCVPQYVSVTSSLTPPCSHERPESVAYGPWPEKAVTAFQRWVTAGKAPSERPALVKQPDFEQNLGRFALWWAEQPAAYKDANANAPTILYARRHGFV